MTRAEKARRMKWWAYWPVAVWAGLALSSIGTALTTKAVYDIQLGKESFSHWFVVIAVWGTLQLLFEFWFCSWIERHFTRKEQRHVLYVKIQKLASNPGRRQKAADRLVAWLEKNLGSLSQHDIGCLGLLAIFGSGLCPRLPKLPTAFVCWSKRSVVGGFLLIVGNILRVIVELSLYLGLWNGVLGAWRILGT